MESRIIQETIQSRRQSLKRSRQQAAHMRFPAASSSRSGVCKSFAGCLFLLLLAVVCFYQTNQHNEGLSVLQSRLVPTSGSSSSNAKKSDVNILRRLEDEEGESQDNNEEEDEKEEEEEQEDEKEEEEEQEQQQQDDDDDNQNNNDDDQNHQDDFFDDFIQDDLVADDDSITYDDFYVFEKDRTPKLLPIDARTVAGFFIASLALSLGASGGTGGGGIVVPIYILILGLPIQVAIPIGAVTVLGGALASTSLNWGSRHPLADRPLVDWDLILVCEPLTLSGALLGTLFHRVLSEKLLVVLLVLLLSITAHTTLSKAMRMYQAEIRYIRHLRAAQADPPSGSSPRNSIFPDTVPKINTWGTSKWILTLRVP